MNERYMCLHCDGDLDEEGQCKRCGWNYNDAITDEHIVHDEDDES